MLGCGVVHVSPSDRQLLATTGVVVRTITGNTESCFKPPTVIRVMRTFSPETVCGEHFPSRTTHDELK